MGISTVLRLMAQEHIHRSCQHPIIIIYELSIQYRIQEEDLYFVSTKGILTKG
jgi:hypothetical protein